MTDCTDFGPCSVTCGGGTRTCIRTCDNGVFGQPGCPADQEINTQACNEQQCRKLNLLC